MSAIASAFMITFAHVADLLTALNMAPGKVEAHPVGQQLLQDPIMAIAAKIALIVLPVSIVLVVQRKKPRVKAFVEVAGTGSGIIGALSNI